MPLDKYCRKQPADRFPKAAFADEASNWLKPASDSLNLQDLLGHAELVREAERRALARLLHGELGSTVAALHMHLAALSQQLSPDAAVDRRMTRIHALLGSLMKTARRTQVGLWPDTLDIFGIEAAVLELSESFEHRTGIRCQLSLPPVTMGCDLAINITLFRVLQQTLGEIGRRARARQVRVVLREVGARVVLSIWSDDGGLTRWASSGCGMRRLQARVRYLGGDISPLDASIGSGVISSLPRMRSRREADESAESANWPLSNVDDDWGEKMA